MSIDSNSNKNNLNAVNYGDVIYSKKFYAFNGYSDSVSAKISIRVDTDGVIKYGNNSTEGIVPGKIQFFTANDDGKLYLCGEFDKSGRFITRQHWSITQNPSGIPMLLMVNTDEPGSGATLSLRRSRGTYENPSSVKKNDSIFKISWHAHDGQSYKETSSIHSEIKNEVVLGNVPSSLVFKTFDESVGYPTDSMKIDSDKVLSVQSLTSLNNTNISMNSPLVLKQIKDEQERDTIITNPQPGTLIFLINLDTVQVYTKTQSWKNLF
jgi:hypothetical protein